MIGVHLILLIGSLFPFCCPQPCLLSLALSTVSSLNLRLYFLQPFSLTQLAFGLFLFPFNSALQAHLADSTPLSLARPLWTL